MNKRDLAGYIQERIENKVMSNLMYLESDVNYYFKFRHKGLAGISNDMVVDQALSAIRHLRVWREIELRTKL